jgi:propanol-preferring alcohol dehydrogenase
MGVSVIGVDVADGPLKVAMDLGTTATIVDARTTTAGEVVDSIRVEDGKVYRAEAGVDAAIILSDNQEAFQYGVDLLRNHGTCVVVALSDKGFQFAANDVVLRDIRIVGTTLGSISRIREMLQFASCHNIKPTIRAFRLEDQYHNGSGGKLVIDMSL